MQAFTCPIVARSWGQGGMASTVTLHVCWMWLVIFKLLLSGSKVDFIKEYKAVDPEATRQEINQAWEREAEEKQQQREAEEKQQQREAEERRQLRIQEIIQNKSLTSEQRKHALAAFGSALSIPEIKGISLFS